MYLEGYVFDENFLVSFPSIFFSSLFFKSKETESHKRFVKVGEAIVEDRVLILFLKIKDEKINPEVFNVKNNITAVFLIQFFIEIFNALFKTVKTS